MKPMIFQDRKNALYQRMVEMLEDQEDAKLVLERRHEPAIEVSIDAL